MATQEAKSSPAYTPQLVATNFVEQYYDKLYVTPKIVHKFYEDSSTITRPNLTDGNMSTASTMQGISDKILSLDYHSCKAEIASIDAQQSCNKGIIVLVTGFLIGEGEMKRSFTQTFFLAPHEKGYFVLNDIFKFGIVIDETVDTAAATDVSETIVSTPVTELKQESAHEPDQQSEVKQSEVEVKQSEVVVKQSEVVVKQSEVVVKQSEIEVKQSEVKQSESVPEKVDSNGLTKSSPYMKSSVDKKGPVLKEVIVSKQPSTSSEQKTEELPKMSYASVLAKVSPVASPVKRSTNPVIVVAPSANSYLDKKKPTFQQAPPQPVNNAPPPRMNNAPPSSDNHSDGKTIYVGNLPPRIPAEELEKVFGEYGPIRKDRIRVITCHDDFCYAFVEFESSDAARKAIEVLFSIVDDKEVHDFSFGGKESYVTEKKPSVQVNNGNMRQTSGKGDYRNNDNNRRSRENSVEGRRDQNGFRGDYGQNRGLPNNRNRNNFHFQNRGSHEFSGQNSWRNGEQRVHQNGGARQAPTSNVK